MVEDNPLRAMVRIQHEQRELDCLKKEWRIIGRKIRSKSQRIPQMIRELNLQ